MSNSNKLCDKLKHIDKNKFIENLKLAFNEIGRNIDNLNIENMTDEELELLCRELDEPINKSIRESAKLIYEEEKDSSNPYQDIPHPHQDIPHPHQDIHPQDIPQIPQIPQIPSETLESKGILDENIVRLYKIDEITIEEGVLGSGAYGDVLIGKFKKDLSKSIILKKFKRFKESKDTDDFFKELIILQYLNRMKAHVVKLYGTLIHEDNIYLIMERFGQSLDHAIMSSKNKLDKEIYRKLFKNILIATGSINAVGIFHSDLKPANILIDDDYNVKIIDFGLSNFLGVGTIVTNYNTYLCTKIYKDQSTTHKSYQSDAYAIGEVFYTLIFRRYSALIKLQPIPNGEIYLVDELSYLNKNYKIEHNKITYNNITDLTIQQMKNNHEAIKYYVTKNTDALLYDIISNLLNTYFIKNNSHKITVFDALESPYFKDMHGGTAYEIIGNLNHYRYNLIQYENKLYEIALLDKIVENSLATNIKLEAITLGQCGILYNCYNNYIKITQYSLDYTFGKRKKDILRISVDEDQIFSSLVAVRNKVTSNINTTDFIKFINKYSNIAIYAFTCLSENPVYPVYMGFADDDAYTVIENPKLDFYMIWTNILYLMYNMRYNYNYILDEHEINDILNILFIIIIFYLDDMTINIWHLLLFIIYKVTSIKPHDRIFLLDPSTFEFYENIYQTAIKNPIFIKTSLINYKY